jgi:hypothetical protein
MPLSDTKLRNLKSAAKDYKEADDKGLRVYVTTKGGKLWRMNCRFDGRQKTLSLGAYPGVSLKKARNRRDEARNGYRKWGVPWGDKTGSEGRYQGRTREYI